MRKLSAIFLVLLFVQASAQDKLYLTDGSVKHGTLVSVAGDAIYFITIDQPVATRFSRESLLVAERSDGVRYVFAGPVITKKSATAKKASRRNIFFVEPLGLITGRATVGYERLSANGRVGLVIPFSLSFDPFGTLYHSRLDTSHHAHKRLSGVTWITGADVNFYVGRKEGTKFFIGPRVRYGTDMFLRNFTGLTLQTQIGWRFGSDASKVVQHLSFGFGFVRILNSPLGVLIDPKRYYSWGSLNYRIGLAW
jgi:hypothetical protein